MSYFLGIWWWGEDRKLLVPASQLLSAQNNPYVKVAWVWGGVCCLKDKKIKNYKVRHDYSNRQRDKHEDVTYDIKYILNKQ